MALESTVIKNVLALDEIIHKPDIYGQLVGLVERHLTTEGTPLIYIPKADRFHYEKIAIVQTETDIVVLSLKGTTLDDDSSLPSGLPSRLTIWHLNRTTRSLTRNIFTSGHLGSVLNDCDRESDMPQDKIDKLTAARIMFDDYKCEPKWFGLDQIQEIITVLDQGSRNPTAEWEAAGTIIDSNQYPYFGAQLI